MAGSTPRRSTPSGSFASATPRPEYSPTPTATATSSTSASSSRSAGESPSYYAYRAKTHLARRGRRRRSAPGDGVPRAQLADPAPGEPRDGGPGEPGRPRAGVPAEPGGPQPEDLAL